MSQKFTDTRQTAGDKAIARFAESMIQRMEEMKSESWRKGWLPAVPGGGVAMNISGRPYSGSNPFMLWLMSAEANYKAPVFLTFNQANKLDVRIKRGETSYPVIYFQPLYKDKDGNKVEPEAIKEMSLEEKAALRFIPIIKVSNVFNIDQTNLAEVKPDIYNKIIARFTPKEYTLTDGMYVNIDLDRMIERQKWVCPIKADKTSDNAYYSPTNDYIVVPVKGQFNHGNSENDIYIAGQEYYSTMLHEMAHSTGHPDRLNRLGNGHFGSPKYAREELIAELTAAFVASSLGFDKMIDANSACYLNSWIQTLKEEPKFIMSILPAVGKASDMIISHIDKMKLEMGEKAVAAFDFLNDIAEDAPFKDISIVRDNKGGMNVRASYGDTYLGMKPLSDRDAKIYSALKDASEREIFKKTICAKTFKEDVKEIKKPASRQQHIAF